MDLEPNERTDTKTDTKPGPSLDFEDDDGEIEEVAETPHFDFMTEYLKSMEEKKRVRQLPRLFLSSFRVVWAAGPAEFVISSVLQLLTGAGAGAQLLIGRDAAASFLHATQNGGSLRGVLPQLVLLGVVTGVMKLLSALQGYQQQRLTTKAGRLAMDKVLDVAEAVDLAAFEAPEFYDRMKRAEMNSQIRPWQMVSGVLGLVSAIAGMIGITWALIVMTPWLAPLVIAAYVPLWLLKKRSTRESYEFMKLYTGARRQAGYLQTVLTGRDEAKEVRAFNLAHTLRRRYDRLNDEWIKEQLRLGRRSFVRNLAGNLATIILTAGVLLLLVYLVLAGEMKVAAAAAAVAAVQMLGTRTEGLLFSTNSLFETRLFVEDYISFVEMRPAFDAARPRRQAPKGFRNVDIENLSFSYPGSSESALEDVSLQIEAGEIVALVGENGSGKTTLAKLLAGLYVPTSGRILWDGDDIGTMDPESVRSSIALIFQDFVRYKLPASENIGMGCHERAGDLEGIAAAARMSGAHRFLRGLPQGYETVLSKEFEGGRDLSVGQWQRVALARAFFRDAPFLILDEPTAALDPKAERRLFDGIRSLSEGRTVLLISHRFSSVRTADRIFVLEAGKLVEQGTHGDLMALDGIYAELFTLQASQFLGKGTVAAAGGSA